MTQTLKKTLKKIPVLGPLGSAVGKVIRRSIRRLRGLDGSGRVPYTFERMNPATAENFEVGQIKNLLNYTKTSGSIFNGQDFPAGYHSIEVAGLHLQGQRNLDERYSRIPIDFTGKTVLDIGCNQGGMLFYIAAKIVRGVGIDYDRRLINAASKVRSYTKSHHIDFYNFDLAQDNLEIIRDLIPGGKVDVAFLLAVAVYLPNWKQVIDIAKDVSSALLYEVNGREEQQIPQIEYLRSRFASMELLSEQSDDRHARKLYLCR